MTVEIALGELWQGGAEPPVELHIVAAVVGDSHEDILEGVEPLHPNFERAVPFNGLRGPGEGFFREGLG